MVCDGPSSAIEKLLAFLFLYAWEGISVLWLTGISRLIKVDGLC